MPDRVRPVLRAGLTLAFLWFGLEKLLGLPAAVELYAELGFGQWPRYVTGTVETLAAIALWTPAAPLVALALMVTMVVGFSAKVLFVGPPVLHLLALFLLTGGLLILDLRRA